MQENQIVFVNTPYNVAEKCKITGVEKNNKKTLYKLHSFETYASFGAYENNVFSTKEEAQNAYLEKQDKQIEEYCSKLNTLEDFLAFPLSHCFCGEEYTDFAARKAYIKKAKELFNISL